MKSQFPYLVDLSLTNQCPLINLCSVGHLCYASPVHKTDELTSFNYFQKVVDEMFKENVLEVAIGGYSEPTTAVLYNDWDIKSLKSGKEPSYISKYNLSDVCKYLKEKHFKVGWTTRNYNLHQLPSIEKLMDNTDSIAFSVTTLGDFKSVQDCIKGLKERLPNKPMNDYNITIQLILETIPYDEFKGLIEEINRVWYKITLLGFKDFGNGRGNKPYNYDAKWIDFMVEITDDNGFGVDSSIVTVWKDELLKRGVESYRLVAEEGSQTCFVDIQKKVMKPSSFTNESYDMTDPKKFNSCWKSF